MASEHLRGERQAWKKAKALVSQTAGDRTRKRGTESVEKDFTKAMFARNSLKIEDLSEIFMVFGRIWMLFQLFCLVFIVVGWYFIRLPGL